MIYVLSGGQTGATLTVTSSGAGTITVSNTSLGKSYSKSVTADGSVVFKGLKTGTWTVKLSNGSQTSTKNITITSDYSTSIAYFSATISITYPAKSKCVVKNSGGTTVASNTNTGSSTKTWTATVNAKGTYTVTATATDGSGKSKSQSVKITADGQSVSVTLSYALYLIKDGVLQNGTEFTRQLRSGQTTAQLPQVGYYRFQTPSNASCGVATSSTFDLTEFRTLNAILSASGANSYGVGIAIINGTAYSTEESMFSNALALAKTTGASKQTISCDVSALSGGNYVGILLGTDISSTADVYDLWLE